MKKYSTYLILMIISVKLLSQLVINPGSSITVTNGTSLYVGTNLYINSDATGTGHLADQNQPGNINITGNISINQYLSANGWHNASSPINNATSNVFSTTDLIFYYDETIILNDWNFGWVWYSGPLEVARGYDVYSDVSTTTNYQSSSSTNLNTGSFTTSITRTDVPDGELENRKGWNLLGNPYPSPTDWLSTNGWSKSNINDAKYIWDPTNNNYTIFIGGSTPTGVNGGTQYIPANQGFWVQAIQNGDFEINNNSRVGVTQNTPGYYKNQETHSEIRIIASANNYTDEAIIRDIDESRAGFDKNIDASKLISFHDSVPQIYTISNNNKLSINSIPIFECDLTIGLNFKCNTIGYYEISLGQKSIISDTLRIFLIDKYLETYAELSAGVKYNFHHNIHSPESRFSLVFNPKSIDLSSKLGLSPFIVGANNSTLTIIRNSSEFGDGIINVYSITGNIIGSYKLYNTTKSSYEINTSSGLYIASIILNNKHFNYKFFIINQ